VYKRTIFISLSSWYWIGSTVFLHVLVQDSTSLLIMCSINLDKRTEFPRDVVLVPLDNWQQSDKETPD